MENLKEQRGDQPLRAIHGASGYRAEVYLREQGDAFRPEAFRRRVLVDPGPSLGEVYLHTPKDLIRHKLLYYRKSQQTKHIRDIVAIIETMGDQLDRAHLHSWIAEKELHALWNTVQQQIQAG